MREWTTSQVANALKVSQKKITVLTKPRESDSTQNPGPFSYLSHIGKGNKVLWAENDIKKLMAYLELSQLITSYDFGLELIARLWPNKELVKINSVVEIKFSWAEIKREFNEKFINGTK